MKTTPLNPNLPLKEMTTELDWSDLVLDDVAAGQVEDIRTWIENSDQLMDDRKLKKSGKRAGRILFNGPHETAKKLTAALLGKVTGLPVYHVDSSAVVSKYIGETEKNLALVFEAPGNGKSILFFDEGDALFNKRTEVKDAGDKYANLQINYFLQRTEDFPGVVILATNQESNMDEALAGRFKSVVQFRLPTAK